MPSRPGAIAGVSAAPPAGADAPAWRGVALYLALIVAGLAGNYFKYPIFLNVDFLFGSIFALLALQLFGLGRGVLAAACISAYTYVLWNHPYAIVIMTAEVALVGWLVGRRKLGLVLADALFWLCLGMPLVYLFYHGVMNIPESNTAIVMTKQAVNGISSALLARLIFTGFALRSRTALIAYRDIIYNLLAFFALCPALILLAVSSRIDFAETDRNMRTELHQKSLLITERLVVWIQNRTRVVVHLTELAATLTPAQMQARLEQARAADANFLRIGMRDAESVVTAYAPPIDDSGQSNVGKRFPERPYIAELKRALKPMLAEVVMGRIGPAKPAVVLLAPVVKGGEYTGYVNSVLNLDQIRNHLEKSAEHDTMLYTLLDRKGNIILSNRKEQKVMTPLVRGEGNLNRLDESVSQWVPALQSNIAVIERWKSSFYVTESRVDEWTLILEQPVAPFQKALYARYSDALGLMFLILLGALALAEFLSRKVVATTEQLSTLTYNLPATLASGGQPAWPQSAQLELDQLIATFRQMAQTLAAQFQANRRLNETLERRVEERTQALAASVAELQRSNADLEQFAYAASHDMRQPLRMISSYLQLLEAELAPVLTSETRANLSFATEGAQRMDQILGALRDYSRIGRKGEAMVETDSREAVDEALGYLGPAIAQAGAEVRVEGEWPRLLANRDEMRRLLQNLIDNALKYRVEGRAPQIVVSAQVDAGEWRVAVSDNGIGLLPGQAARLFKVFERLQPRSRFPGTGIGLALCRKIAEHHNGRISVQSAGENQGCTFVFSLPMADARAGAAAADQRLDDRQDDKHGDRQNDKHSDSPSHSHSHSHSHIGDIT